MKNNQSILTNLGVMFLGAYFIYFLLMPGLYFLNLWIDFGPVNDNVIYDLYTRKGIWFLSYESLFYIFTGMIFFMIGYFSFFRNSDKLFQNFKFLNQRWSFRNILITSFLLFSGFQLIIAILFPFSITPNFI